MLTPTQQAYKAIATTLNRERAMRVRVFRNTAKYDSKVAEIDDALKALDVLAMAIKRQQEQATQESLFA